MNQDVQTESHCHNAYAGPVFPQQLTRAFDVPMFVSALNPLELSLTCIYDIAHSEFSAMDPIREGFAMESDELYASYDPTFEWPGDESDSNFKSVSPLPASLIKGQPILRLVVLQTAVLPSKRRIAALDTYHEAQLGRDVQSIGSVVPRVRLKEMEVSKLHATIFWDSSRKEWNVVDMGSKHGTFLQSGSSLPPPQAVGIRLSQPRFASIPRRLRHRDRLSVGSTTFQVHIHEDQRPCEGCTISDNHEIPLFSGLHNRTRDAELGPDTVRPTETAVNKRDPTKMMSMLKRNLLKTHTERKDPRTSLDENANHYVDRAARRRVLHGSTYSESPGVPISKGTIGDPPSSTQSKQEDSMPPRIEEEGGELPCPLAVPISSSNIGHRLLLRQGWIPGTALGIPSENSGLIDPLELRLKTNRAGLGSKREQGTTRR